MSTIPEVKCDAHGIPTLYVKGEPFLALSGELHNSSASSPEFMEKDVWPKLEGLHMNSVILPVYWEQIEAVEGVYDFSVPDALIAQARERGIHLIFLWFGLWKNAESMYVPGWMKRDTQTYFRAQKVSGEKINTISPLCKAAVEKDAAAFRQLMAHIRALDEDESTVIVMQVENEIGLLGTPRDYSPQANEAFAQPVPKFVIGAVNAAVAKKAAAGNTGSAACDGEGCAEPVTAQMSWKEAFGEDAEEYFMAYYFASAVETIASAGRSEYPLPCYANAWLRQYPWYAGSYPSGGPVREVQPIWKAAAPSLFTLAPDIYVPYVADVMEEYSYEGNPLFIPEVRKDCVTASYCLYAFGGCNAMCYSPFGIEDLALDPSTIERPPMEVMAALNIDPSAFDIAGSREILADTYDLMAQLKPIYLQYRGTSHLKSCVKKSETDFGAFLSFEKYNISVAYLPKAPLKPLPVSMIIELEPDKFLLIGMMCRLTFSVKNGENLKAEMISLQEGQLKDGIWEPQRIFNGDEKMSLKFGDRPTCYMIELYKY